MKKPFIIGWIILFLSAFYFYSLAYQQSLILTTTSSGNSYQNNLNREENTPHSNIISLFNKSLRQSTPALDFQRKPPKFLQIPILNYHYIRKIDKDSDPLGFTLSVTPKNFFLQMDWLFQNGYTPVFQKDLAKALVGEKLLAEKPIVLSFDDGYADFYTNALPILKKFKFKSTIFVISDFLQKDDGRYLTPRQLKLIAGSKLVEIGSHSASHANLVNPNIAIQREISGSKRSLEQLTGQAVVSFAYPSGRFDERAINFVKRAGFTSALTTRASSHHTLSGIFYLGRVRISGGDSIESFAKKVKQASMITGGK